MSTEPPHDEGGPSLAPDGARCPGHEDERFAIVRCPACAGFACLECWHGRVGACARCIEGDPAAFSPPIAWEDPARGVASRFAGTLASALSLSALAPAFARTELRPAVTFAFASALPLALLYGVIPFTRTLQFGPSGRVRVLGATDAAAIALDVAMAAGLGVLYFAVLLTAVALPYVSLARAFGRTWAGPSAARFVLYRAWLLPLSFHGLLFHGAAWWLPQTPAEWMLVLVQLVDVVPLVIFVFGMRATSRVAGRVSPLASLGVVLVPTTLLFLVNEVALRALAPWMPPVIPSAA